MEVTAPQRKPHMNVILLISDTFRFDNLFDRAAACPLGMSVRTPNLDAFAGRAVSMTRTYNSSFPTIPHRTDLTSGRFGWLWHGWQDLRRSGPNHAPVLLRQAGYVSQLLCDTQHLIRSGFDLGFDAAHGLRGQESDRHFLRLNHPIRRVQALEKTRPPSGSNPDGPTLADIHTWANAEWRYEEDRFAPRTARMATNWLEENYLHNPFFLWVDFFDPHEPWDPPEYMVRRYDGDYDGPPMIHPNYGNSDAYTAEELRNLRAHYCAEAELVDRWIGRVLQKIDDLQLWDNSVVVFTTDHGMSIGEHSRTGKSNLTPADGRHWPLYPEIAHLPLMIAAPDLEGGREIDAIVQPPDILPTLLDLVGAEVEPPEPFHGRSFASLLRGPLTHRVRCVKGGQDEGPFRELAVSGAFMRPTGEGTIGPRHSTPVIYAKQWAYAPVGADGERELFDLGHDPYAETNVAGDHADVADELHRRFLDWLTDLDAPPELVGLFSRK